MIIMLAVIMPVLFLFINFQNKAWRKNEVDTLSCMAISKIIALPVFVFTLIYIVLFEKDYVFTYKWLGFSFAWAALCFITNYLETFLFKYYPMTQIKAFNMIFRFVLTAFIDMIFFNVIFTYNLFIPIFLLFVGGILINRDKFNMVKEYKTYNIYILILVSLINTSLYVLQLGIMKELAVIQTNPLFFVAFLQTILFSSNIIAGGKKTFTYIKDKKISLKSIFLVNLILIIYCFCEPFVLKELPLTVIVATGIVTITLTYLYDIKTNDLSKNKISLFGFLLIAVGIILLLTMNG